MFGMSEKSLKWAVLILLLAGVSCSSPVDGQAQNDTPVVQMINGYQVVSVSGTPEQIGEAYGLALAPTIQRVVNAVLLDAYSEEAYENMLEGSKVMEAFQPEEYLRELRAMAEAAEVRYEDLLLLQYFGDVRRGITGTGRSHLCTSFAALPPITRGDTCIVGRNFDYFDKGVGNYASILAYYAPEGRIPFVTVTWVGVINGWTLLNAEGIVVSNNTALNARSNSLEGVSTCFVLRYVAERARTVEEGIELVRNLPRACGTNMLIAQGNPPDAVIIEFDHENFAVRRPTDGFVGADNSFLTLTARTDEPVRYTGRIGVADSLVRMLRGRIDVTTNIAGADGVPIHFMNLHSAMIDATNRRLLVAMGGIPAYRLPYRGFRLTDNGIVADEMVAEPVGIGLR